VRLVPDQRDLGGRLLPRGIEGFLSHSASFMQDFVP